MELPSNIVPFVVEDSKFVDEFFTESGYVLVAGLDFLDKGKGTGASSDI